MGKDGVVMNLYRTHRTLAWTTSVGVDVSYYFEMPNERGSDKATLACVQGALRVKGVHKVKETNPTLATFPFSAQSCKTGREVEVIPTEDGKWECKAYL